VTRGGDFDTIAQGILRLRKKASANANTKAEAEADADADGDALPPLEDARKHVTTAASTSSTSPASASASDAALVADVTRERLLALITYHISLAAPLFNKYGFAPFEREYLRYWMHTGAKVRVEGKQGEYEVTGLAPSGYLRAVNTKDQRYVGVSRFALQIF
jgi:hypothetical protein